MRWTALEPPAWHVMWTPRVWRAAGLAMAVLLLHVWALQPVRSGAERLPSASTVARAWSVRLLPPAGPVAATQAVSSDALANARDAVVPKAQTAPVAPAAPTSNPAKRSGERPRTEPLAEATPRSTEAVPAPAPPQPTHAERIPVYPNRPPASATLNYRASRNGQTSQAQLQWHLENGQYRLELTGAWPGQPALSWASLGQVDEHGLAPQRYADRRRGRDVRAANFERDDERITFSASGMAYPLWPGVQDRLSWWLQLPAVAQAHAQPWQPGEAVVLLVASARGEAERWVFEYQGREAVAAGEAPPGTGLLRFERQARRPYDTAVVVWLDPARQHLPARLRLAHPPSPQVLELSLQEP